MDVAPGGVAGRTLVADHLAGLDVLAGLDRDGGPLVGIDAAIAVPVVDDDDDRQRSLQARPGEHLLVGGQIAVPAHEVDVVSPGRQDDAVVRRHDVVSALGCHVHAVVEQLAVHEELAPLARPEGQRDPGVDERPDVAGQLGGRGRRGWTRGRRQSGGGSGCGRGSRRCDRHGGGALSWARSCGRREGRLRHEHRPCRQRHHGRDSHDRQDETGSGDAGPARAPGNSTVSACSRMPWGEVGEAAHRPLLYHGTADDATERGGPRSGEIGARSRR